MTENIPIEIDPHELHQLLESGDPVELIDCREPHEFEICRISEPRLLPTTQIHDWLPKFTCEPDRPVVVYCHHGIRSFHVVAALRSNGFPQARSLSGGIEAWSQQIDPEMPSY